jgi:hypothetical protein
MYKKYFCTFADSRMKKSLERIEKQAKSLDFFDKIIINDETNLDQSFKETFKDKLIKGSRGYGYWVWKPQIILQALDEMQDGDILLYADVGCHLNKNGIERLKYYFEKANLSESGLFVFQEAVKTDDDNLETGYSHLEKFYTKGDIFDHFNVKEKHEIFDTGMIIATTFLIRKCEKSQDIINKWLDVFKINFNLVDNSPSKSQNFDGFIENRHDQSIFSILCKLNNIASISSYETWQSDWKKLDKYPILAKRDKDLGIFWRIHRKITTIINNIKLQRQKNYELNK